MLDVGRGPLLVAVADRPAAIINSAELRPAERAVRPGRSARRSVRAAEPGWLRARLRAAGSERHARHRHHPQRRAGRRFAGARRRPACRRFTRRSLADRVVGRHRERRDHRRRAGGADRGARPGAQLIVSHHDFARTPPLDDVARRSSIAATRSPGAIAKIATAVATRGRSAHAARAARAASRAHLRHRHGRVGRSPHRARGARLAAGVRLPGDARRRRARCRRPRRTSGSLAASPPTPSAARTALTPRVSERSSRRAAARPSARRGRRTARRPTVP